MTSKVARYGMRCAALFALQLLTAGCVTTSPAAKGIYLVHSTQEVSACTRIGPVSAKSMACVDPPSCMSAAEAEARNEAATMGATHLLKTCSGVDLTHGLFDGYAYRCADNQVGVQRMELSTQTPIPEGCTKDVECKNDRVCENGRCVSPPIVPEHH